MATNIEERLAAIEARNRRVEDDKAWETSWARRISIMIVTYLAVAAYFHFIIRINPWTNALVPVLGFFASTLTISLIKSLWLRHRA